MIGEEETSRPLGNRVTVCLFEKRSTILMDFTPKQAFGHVGASIDCWSQL